jgi:Na+/proline symporter
MSPVLVLITIAAYFAILFTISYIAGRKADNAGFFVGNRKSTWYVVAFAMIGSSISGVTFVSVPGMLQRVTSHICRWCWALLPDSSSLLFY